MNMPLPGPPDRVHRCESRAATSRRPESGVLGAIVISEQPVFSLEEEGAMNRGRRRQDVRKTPELGLRTVGSGGGGVFGGAQTRTRRRTMRIHGSTMTRPIGRLVEAHPRPRRAGSVACRCRRTIEIWLRIHASHVPARRYWARRGHSEERWRSTANGWSSKSAARWTPPSTVLAMPPDALPA